MIDEKPLVPRVGSAVIVVHDGKLLLGRRAKQPNEGRWVLPGGKVEPFEPIEDAAVREALEETGLAIEVTGQIGVYQIISAPAEHRIIIYNSATPIGGEIRPGSDLHEVRFFGRDELEKLDLTDIVREVLSDTGWLDTRISAPAVGAAS